MAQTATGDLSADDGAASLVWAMAGGEAAVMASREGTCSWLLGRPLTESRGVKQAGRLMFDSFMMPGGRMAKGEAREGGARRSGATKGGGRAVDDEAAVSTLQQDPRVVPAPGSYKGSANWARDTPLGPDFIGTNHRAAACFLSTFYPDVPTVGTCAGASLLL